MRWRLPGPGGGVAGPDAPGVANTQPRGQFTLKSISWKVKGGAIVKDEIPVWGSAFAYDTQGDYHQDIRGDLVRYLEFNGTYIHHEAGEAYEVTLNEWNDKPSSTSVSRKTATGAADNGF